MLVGLPLLILGAIFVQAPPHIRIDPSATASSQGASLSDPDQPASRPDAAAPYNGNFGAMPPVRQSIPREAFTTAPLRAPLSEHHPANDLSELQVSLKTFGLLSDPASGILDKATRKSFRMLAMVSGMPANDPASARAALRTSEQRAERMLWILGTFPFGKTLPSWLLASLEPSDANSLSQAFNLHADTLQHTFSVPLKASGLIVRAQLFPDDRTPRCYAFSALFERGPLQHHVISRACRDAANKWAMAAQDHPALP